MELLLSLPPPPISVYSNEIDPEIVADSPADTGEIQPVSASPTTTEAEEPAETVEEASEAEKDYHVVHVVDYFSFSQYETRRYYLHEGESVTILPIEKEGYVFDNASISGNWEQDEIIYTELPHTVHFDDERRTGLVFIRYKPVETEEENTEEVEKAESYTIDIQHFSPTNEVLTTETVTIKKGDSFTIRPLETEEFVHLSTWKHYDSDDFESLDNLPHTISYDDKKIPYYIKVHYKTALPAEVTRADRDVLVKVISSLNEYSAFDSTERSETLYTIKPGETIEVPVPRIEGYREILNVIGEPLTHLTLDYDDFRNDKYFADDKIDARVYLHYYKNKDIPENSITETVETPEAKDPDRLVHLLVELCEFDRKRNENRLISFPEHSKIQATTRWFFIPGDHFELKAPEIEGYRLISSPSSYELTYENMRNDTPTKFLEFDKIITFYYEKIKPGEEEVVETPNPSDNDKEPVTPTEESWAVGQSLVHDLPEFPLDKLTPIDEPKSDQPTWSVGEPLIHTKPELVLDDKQTDQPTWAVGQPLMQTKPEFPLDLLLNKDKTPNTPAGQTTPQTNRPVPEKETDKAMTNIKENKPSYSRLEKNHSSETTDGKKSLPATGDTTNLLTILLGLGMTLLTLLGFKSKHKA